MRCSGVSLLFAFALILRIPFLELAGVDLLVNRAGLQQVGVPAQTTILPSSSTMIWSACCRLAARWLTMNTDGKVNPVVLAAAKEAGADRVFKIGGAQAIAAFATEPRAFRKSIKS